MRNLTLYYNKKLALKDNFLKGILKGLTTGIKMAIFSIQPFQLGKFGKNPANTRRCCFILPGSNIDFVQRPLLLFLTWKEPRWNVVVRAYGLNTSSARCISDSHKNMSGSRCIWKWEKKENCNSKLSWLGKIFFR